MSTRRFRGALALGALIALLAVSACSPARKTPDLGDPDASAPGAASSAPASARTVTSGQLTLTLPSAGSAEQEAVFAGYQAFWTALLGALAKANPNDPALAATVTGGALSVFRNNLANMSLVRRTQTGPAHLNPTVTSITGSLANLNDCADLSQLRVRDRSGTPVNPPDPQTTHILVGMVLKAGRWLVQTYDEDTRGCTPEQ